MSDNFDEVFSTASHMMKSRQEQTPEPGEGPMDDFFPGEEIPDDSESDPDEEELLLAQKTASAEWRKEKDAGTMALSEEDYVTGKTQCTPEEFQVRRNILENLSLAVKEEISYNEVPEDVLDAMASLTPDEQDVLANDLKAGKIKARILTLPQVQGYRSGISVWDEPEDETAPEDSSEPEPAKDSGTNKPESLLTTEEVPEPETREDDPDDPEPAVSDPQQASLRKAKERDLKIVEELARDYDREHPEAERSSESEPEPEDQPEPESAEPVPAAAPKPDIPSAVEEIAANGEPEEEPENSEPDSSEPDESQIRGLMYRESLDPLLDMLETYLPKIRQTAGTAVTEKDYHSMMADAETLRNALTGLFDYYLDNALDTIPEELREENASEEPDSSKDAEPQTEDPESSDEAGE